MSHSNRRAHAPAARKSTDIGLNFALTKENNYFFYPKKPHLWLSIILGIVGVCLLLFVIVIIIHTLSGGGGVGGGGGNQQITITYRVTGNGSADLTLENASGNTEQLTAPLPWSRTFISSPGSFVYISAQLNGTGNVQCDILSNGTVIETATSSGEYVIADCSGTARLP